MTADAARVELARGATIGRFVIDDVIGAGGMGVVYRAHDPELDRAVAIKVLRPRDELPFARDAEARLVREAQAMARLSHPNVVHVYEVGREDDRVFLVMELVTGRTLAAWSAGRSAPEIVAAYVAAGRGLAAAHASGLVHRDFKPENVFVGDDGRVRVGDFGLVGLGESGAAPTDGGDGALEVDLTRTGVLLGTPRYISPEQHRHEPATARSDQFSFAVALWSTLAGEPPFAGDTFRALIGNVLEGNRRPAPRTMPARVRRALERALATDPAARFPDMDALLAALTPPPRTWRWAAATVGALGLAATAAAVALGDRGDARPAATPPPPCTGAEARFAPVWGPGRADALRAGLRATGAARADAFADRVIARLDAYAATWVTTRHDACAATRIRGDQSDAVMDLRMACLDQRAREVDALVTDLLAISPAELDGAIAATYKLTPVRVCDDLAALTAPRPPPTDPDARAKVEALDADVATIRAHLYVGRYQQASELASATVRSAAATGYGPLTAEATELLGEAQAQSGDVAAARTSFENAALAAEAARHDTVAADALAALVFVVGYQQGDFAAGQELARRADAAILRLGDPDAPRGRLELNLGAASYAHGDAPAAIEHWERALALWTRAYGADDPNVASVRNNLGAVYGDVGRDADALTQLERTVEIWVKAFGERHPRVAIGRHNLGTQLHQVGRLDDARAMLEAALATAEGSLGAEHPELPRILADLGNVYIDLGRLDDAWASLARAVEIGRARGEDRVLWHVGLATIRRLQGRLDDARAEAAAAAALVERAGPDAPRDGGYVHGVLAEIELAAHAWRRAEAEATEAVAELEKVLGPDAFHLIAPLVVVARARIERGELAGAEPPLARAIALADPRYPLALAPARLAVAELRWRQGRTAEARAAAADARRLLDEVGLGADRAQTGELDAWLAAHPEPVKTPAPGGR